MDQREDVKKSHRSRKYVVNQETPFVELADVDVKYGDATNVGISSSTTSQSNSEHSSFQNRIMKICAAFAIGFAVVLSIAAIVIANVDTSSGSNKQQQLNSTALQNAMDDIRKMVASVQTFQHKQDIIQGRSTTIERTLQNATDNIEKLVGSVHALQQQQEVTQQQSAAFKARILNTTDDIRKMAASFQTLQHKQEDTQQRLIFIERNWGNLLNASTIKNISILTLINMTSATTYCAASPSNGRQVFRPGEYIYCEDGWTVFQRRFDGSVDFQVNWNEYKNGFGNLSGEFWLGLDKIHRLTSQGNCRLRVDLQAFDDDRAYAEYSSFCVSNECDKYRLHVTGYNGTAGDSLDYHNNNFFSTNGTDNDNDNGDCAASWGGGGGWWFNKCFYSSLNAVWGPSEGKHRNIIWYHWKGNSESLKATTMKLRCD